MPSQESSSPSPMAPIEPERALRLGAAAAVAPLWAAFFAAAGAGVTYWWMTAWTRRQFQPAAAEPKSYEPKAAPKTAPEIAAPRAARTETVQIEIAAPKVAAPRVAAPEITAPEITAPKAVAPAITVTAPEPAEIADVASRSLETAPEKVKAQRPAGTQASLPGLPAEITAADPVERALERGADAAAKPARRKAVRKPQA